MVRRRLTLKRIDPWSTLKFGFIANLSLLAIWMLGAGVIWFFVQRLQLIDKVCSIATDMGFVECGINGGNLFRALFLLGLLGVVINTGLVVFLAFLHNLIADLVGGVSFSFVDDTPGAAARGEVSRTAGTTGGGQTPVAAGTAASSMTAGTSAPTTSPQTAARPQQPARPSSPHAPPTQRTQPASSPQSTPHSQGAPAQSSPTQPRPAQGSGPGQGTSDAERSRGAPEDRVFGDRSGEQSPTRVQPDREGPQDR